MLRSRAAATSGSRGASTLNACTASTRSAAMACRLGQQLTVNQGTRQRPSSSTVGLHLYNCCSDWHPELQQHGDTITARLLVAKQSQQSSDAASVIATCCSVRKQQLREGTSRWHTPYCAAAAPHARCAVHNGRSHCGCGVCPELCKHGRGINKHVLGTNRVLRGIFDMIHSATLLNDASS